MHTKFPVALGALLTANVCMSYEPDVNDPAWWIDSTTSIYADGVPPAGSFDHSSPINVGQLKHVSAQAGTVLDQELASIGTGPYIDVLVSSFTAPDPENFAPANIGQLKNVASHFYERFAAIGFGPGDAGWPVTLTLTEDDPNLNDGVPMYPWTENQSPENMAPANVGQLKHLFSWDVAEYVVVDSEPDLLPDYWEFFYFNDLDEVAEGDPDGDGRTNLQEFEAGTDPTVAPALLINEPFAYPTGDIDGVPVGAGTGLAGTWSGTTATADDGTSVVAASSALAYGALARNGGELKLLDRANMYGSVDSTMLNDAGVLDDGSTLWISFVVRTDDATGTNNNQSFAFGTDEIKAHAYQMKMDNSGSGVGISLDRGSRLNAAYWDGGIRTYSNTVTTSAGSTNLVVLSITWGPSGEIIRLYMPGTDLSLPEVVETIITPGNLDQSTFDTITYSHRGTNGVSDQIDEIRFATTYQGLFGAGGSDITSPTITALSPADNATEVEVNTSMVATFNENVTRGTGQITIKNLSDSTETTIDIADETQVSISGNAVTINPSYNLDAGKDYAVQVDSTAIIDLAGNAFAGINDDTTWNFTNTAPLDGQLFSEDFEIPSSPTAYSEGVTPDVWVRADNGYGANRHGIVDQAGGDFTVSGSGEQAYAFRYTNTGITTSEGVVGSLSLNTTYTVYVDVVRDDGLNVGTPYGIEFVAFDPGADRTECRSIRTGTVLASNFGDAPSDGTWNTISVQFDVGGSSSHLGKDIAVRLIGGSTSAIVDNIVVTSESDGGGDGDVTAPAIVELNPSDDAVDVAVDTNFVVTFDEEITAGTGLITVKNLTDSTETDIDITDPIQVSISGSALTIYPASNFGDEIDYAVQIDASAIGDLAGNAFVGISDDTTWNFKTTFEDVDGDGLPDAWEIDIIAYLEGRGYSGLTIDDILPYDLTPTLTSDDYLSDADEDGISNADEYADGTDPTDFYNGDNPDPNTAPAAPSNFQAFRLSDGRILYTWDDNSNNEDGFKIRRENHEGVIEVIAIVPANQTSVIVDPLPPAQ